MRGIYRFLPITEADSLSLRHEGITATFHNRSHTHTHTPRCVEGHSPGLLIDPGPPGVTRRLRRDA